MTQICRLCLRRTNKCISVFQCNETGVTTANFIEALIPEVFLGLTYNPILCSICYEILREAYEFRLECLKTDNLISIFKRETKWKESYVELHRVVEFWKNRNKCGKTRGSLVEWPIEEPEQNPPPLILNQAAASECQRWELEHPKNVGANLQKEKTISRLGEGKSEKDKSAKVNTTDLGVLKHLLTSPVIEIDSGETVSVDNSGKLPNNVQQNKCTCHALSQGAGKSNYYPSCNFCKERSILEETEHDAIVEFDEYMNQACLEFSEPVVKKSTASVRTYAKQPKTAAEPEGIDPKVIFTVKPSHKKKQINLVGHDVGTLNEVEMKNLIRELQKTENLKKLGFNENDSKKESSYVVKKLDNGPNFALFPMLPAKLQKNDSNDVSNETDPNTNQIATFPVEKEPKSPLINLLDSLRERLRLFRKANASNKEFSDEIITTYIREFEESVKIAINDATDEGKNDAIENIKKGYLHLIERLKNANFNLANGDEWLKLDTVGEKPNDIENVCEEGEKSDNNGSDQSEESDGESLDVINFPPDPQDADKPPDLTPPDKPMPVIRVRPVSTLQKVRTLNHELWPQKAVSSDAEVNFETPSNVVYKVPTKLVDSDSSQPPIVLNSKLVSAPADLMTSIAPPKARVDDTETTVARRITKIVDKEMVSILSKRQAKKFGINPLRLSKESILNKFRVIMPKPEKVYGMNQERLYPVSSVNAPQEAAVVSRRESGDRDIEDAIDIKEEPLEYTDNVLSDFDNSDYISQGATESEGETTRSASETSYLDRHSPQNELLKSIMDNISEVGEMQYDEPEYVHINQVSFTDLARIMSESRKQEKLVDAELDLNQVPPIPTTTNTIAHTDDHLKGVELSATKAASVGGTTTPKRRICKRLRLVPVDADEDGVVRKVRRKVVNQQSVLKTNVVSAPVKERTSNPDKDVCVLYTNFTSQGDYINDHDYLPSPYVRNRMYYTRSRVPFCVCLLCNFVHHANYHVEHMEIHETVCEVCKIDFHNVFILNLHVKNHRFYCSLCKKYITYGIYKKHEELHRASSVQSDYSGNIVVNADEPNQTLSQQGKEKQVDSRERNFMSLADLLNVPVTDKYPLNVVSQKDQTNTSLRKTKRKIRVPGEGLHLDEEGYCVWNKNMTKSYIAPKKDKLKLVEKNNSEREKTDSSCIILGDSGTEDDDETTKPSNSTTDNTPHCHEIMDKEIVDNESLVQINKPLSQQNDPTKNKPKKLSKIGKKRRTRRIFTLRPKKKAQKRDIPHDKSKETVNLADEEKETRRSLPEKSNARKFENEEECLLVSEKKAQKRDIPHDKSKETLNLAAEEKETRRSLPEKSNARKSENEEECLLVSDSRPQVDDSLHTETLKDPKSDLSVKSTLSTYPIRSRISNKDLAKPDSAQVIKERCPRTSRSSAKSKQNKPASTSSEPDAAISDISTVQSSESFERLEAEKDSLNSSKTDLNTVETRDAAKNSLTNPVILLEPMDNASCKIVPPVPIKKYTQTRKKGGDTKSLKIKIKSIKLNPFISKVKKSTKSSLKTYTMKRKRNSVSPEVVSNTAPPAEEEEKDAASNIEKQESEVDVDVKKRKTEGKATEDIAENISQTDGTKKEDLRLNPFSSNKSRSSRSRGSLGLVEGLKGSEIRRPGRKTWKKSKEVPKEESSFIDLDASQSKDVDPLLTSTLDPKTLQGENVVEDNKIDDKSSPSTLIKDAEDH